MKRNLVRRLTSMALAGAMALSTLTVSPTMPVMAATVSQLKEGVQYKIVSKKTGKVLTVENDSKSNSAKVEQQTEDTKASQLWELDFDNNGYCNIVNVNSGKALDIPNKSKTKGEKIIQFDKNTNSDNQKWKISEVNGEYCKITTKLSTGYALNIEGAKTNNGAKLIQWNYGGGSNEQWKFVEVKKENEGTRFEAEDYVVGDATVVNSGNASGGKYVGNVKGESVKVFMWSEDASYTLKIRYASAEPRDMNVEIRNNNAWPTSETYPVYCPSTGDWSKMGEKEVNVEMQAGYNQIVITGANGNYAPNIDCIDVIARKGEVVYHVEAEKCGGGDAVNCANASGGQYLGNFKYEIYDAVYPEAGKYILRLAYATAEERAFRVELRSKYGVNDVKDPVVICPSTGGWDKFGIAEVEIEFEDNEHTWIYIAPENGEYAPNLDYFEIVRR